MSENIDEAYEKSYELVTESLVKSALGKDKGKDAELLSFEIKPFTNKGDNYTSVVTSVLVRHRLNGSEFHVSYVAKLNPLRPASSFTEVLEQMFGRETDVFSSIVGGMNKQLEMLGFPPLKTPKLLAHCLEKGKESFLTEDLRLQGFKMFDRRKGMDLVHASLVMKELGRFHASSLLYEETLHPKTIPEAFDYFEEKWQDASHDSFKIFDSMMISQVECSCNFLKKAGPKYKKCESWLRDHMHEMTRIFIDGFQPQKPFDIFVHGDCWTNNMLFRYNEDDTPVDLRFVDLQCSRKSSPASDLNYFFFTSLNGELRNAERETLIKIYYDAFREVLETSGKELPFSIQELIEEVKKRKIFGLCCALLILPAVLSEGDEIWDVDEFSEENLDEFLKKQKGKYEKLSERQAFKERFLPVFDEMIQSNIFDEVSSK